MWLLKPFRFRFSDFKILSFPCNQFGSQAPEKDGEEMVCHLAKASANFGDLFKKIDVNGSNEAPLYRFLKQKIGGLLGEALAVFSIVPKIEELLKQ